MYLGGAGGTGKSQTIRALRALFAVFGKSAWLVTSAVVGTAAAQIGGATVASLTGTGQGRHGLETEDDNGEAKRSSRYSNPQLLAAKFVIIDEASTLGQRGLAEQDAAMRRNRGSLSDQPFGGTHIVFAGDFRQLPPVADTPLYAAPAKLPKALERVQGRYAWSQVEHVVLLTKQNRQSSSDEATRAFLERLTRLSTGSCTRADYEWFRTRTIGENDEATRLASTPRFQRAPMVVSRNLVRMIISNEYLLSFARQTRLRLLVSVARDLVSTKQGRFQPLPRLRRSLLDLHDGKVGFHTGKLALAEGMQIVLKHNVATAARLTNGARGQLLRIVLDEREDAAEIDRSPVDQPYFLRYLPQYLLVHFPDCSLQLPGLPTGVVPLFPLEKTFQHRCKVTVPAGDGQPSDEVQSKRVARMQFPILSGKALTDYTVQGLTLDAGVVDLATKSSVAGRNRKSTAHPAVAYVPLSRFRSPDDFLILRDFPYSAITRPPPPELQRFLDELASKAVVTARRFSDWRGEGEPVAAPDVLVNSGASAAAATGVQSDSVPNDDARAAALPAVANLTIASVLDAFFAPLPSAVPAAVVRPSRAAATSGVFALDAMPSSLRDNDERPAPADLSRMFPGLQLAL